MGDNEEKVYLCSGHVARRDAGWVALYWSTVLRSRIQLDLAASMKDEVQVNSVMARAENSRRDTDQDD